MFGLGEGTRVEKTYILVIHGILGLEALWDLLHGSHCI